MRKRTAVFLCCLLASGAVRAGAAAAEEKARIASLARRKFGERAALQGVFTWRAVRVTAEGPHGGELRWLLLLATKGSRKGYGAEGAYNMLVVGLAHSSRNASARLPKAPLGKLSTLPRPVIELPSFDMEMSEALRPHLLRGHILRTSPTWRSASWRFEPIGEVREYAFALNMPVGATDDAVPISGSFYVDRDGMVLHHKITDILTISR